MSHRLRRRAASALALIALLIVSTTVALPASAAGPDDPGCRRDPLFHLRAEAAGKAEAAARAASRATQIEKSELTGNRTLWDVTYYDLEITLDPENRDHWGVSTIRATVLGESIDYMVVNCSQFMEFTSATVNGQPTTWSKYVLGDVRINLDRDYLQGETVELVLGYSGAFLEWGTRDELTVAYTWSQPYNARDWWPCKDHESDKADSLDVHVTVPAAYTGVSNGVLTGVDDHGDTRTFHWRHRHPIVTYNVAVNAYPYTEFIDWYTPLEGGDPMPIQNYMFPSEADSVQPVFDLADEVMTFFAGLFGEYPFLDEHYGHVQDTRSGGMEHQTMTAVGVATEELVVHELSHSWFGNHVTVADFADIWLHEGMATWCEALWAEHTGGPEAYRAYMQLLNYFGPGTIYVEGDSEAFYEIFEIDLSYKKAAWMVHMLRGVLGDDDFFESLRRYLVQFAEGSATTLDMQTIMETVSGQDLDGFFTQWLYGEYFPVYDLSWQQNGSTLELTISQVQTNAGLFDMPMEIQVNTDLGPVFFDARPSLAQQSYSFPVSGQVESVFLDPDNWILKQVRIPLDNPLFTRGVLLVNGGALDHDRYIPEMAEAYDDSVYTGTIPFDFWDAFDETLVGYPESLPAPRGHGAIPPEIIADYRTVVWFGNNYLGDLASWEATPILDYLEVGGNVMVLGRRGSDFLSGELADYAGITWMEFDAEIAECTAVHPGLVDVPLMEEQTYNDLFSTTVAPHATLLTVDNTGFAEPRGLGVYALPTATPLVRPEGGKLVFLGGRPYRMDHQALRANTDYILRDLFGEPDWVSGVPDGEQVAAARTRLMAGYPNPFNPMTTIPFFLAKAGRVELEIYDVAGRHVRTLVSAELPAGPGEARWDGADGAGREVASGTYFARLRHGEAVEVRPLMLVR